MTRKTFRAGFINYLKAILFIVTIGCVQTAAEEKQATESRTLPTTAAQYRREIQDLHILTNYRAQKNSFCLGLETRSGLALAIRKGERKTLLAAEGCGSLRHIWETHGKIDDPFELEIFIDGRKEPSIRGKLIDIIAAAQSCRQPFIANAGGTVTAWSHNLYLPIPFEKSIRLDLISTEKMNLNFFQLDYRLKDCSMKGIRLEQSGEGRDMKLAYSGIKGITCPEKNCFSNLKRRSFEFTGDEKVRLSGPAIIRRLAMNAARQGVRLRIRFDGESSNAVDVDLADFFGPFRGTVFNNNRCYLPMPFKNSAEIEICGSSPNQEWYLQLDTEKVERFKSNWGYFHAKSNQTEKSTGYMPHQGLYTRGRGHWIGMSLYETGHVHGGGDFAVIDGETAEPSFLHGINGEDYFSFAWAGLGENFPYSEAIGCDTGCMRIHIENPYPFRESIEIAFATLRNPSPRSVAFWYQASPKDKSSMGESSQGLQWQVFGPAKVPLLDNSNTPDVSNPERLFAALPDEDRLDAGEQIEVKRFCQLGLQEGMKKRARGWQKGLYNGWSKQQAVGPHLNLTYIYRHVMDLGGNSALGYGPRCMMARAKLTSAEAKKITFQLSYDDPLVVYLNKRRIFTDMQLTEGFVTKMIEAELLKGQNLLLVKMLDTPNNNDCWAAISLRILDENGHEISSILQPRKDK